MIRALALAALAGLFLHSPVLQSSYISETNVVLIGDSGKNNEGQRAVAMAMKDLCDREVCDMGILAGDNVYPAGLTGPNDQALVRVFDDYYNQLNIPFLIALGNHDYGKLGRSKKKASWQLLHPLRNPSYVLPHYWHMKETPEAIFAVIDTARLMWRRDIAQQGAFVDEVAKLARAKNKWFFVVGHHPYLSNGPHGNAGRYERLRFPFFISGKYIKRFLDRHVCGKAHFYLAGHDHSLQAIDGLQVGCETQLIVSGSAASVTKLAPRNEVKFEALELGFFHLSISQEEVRVRAFNEGTQQLYEEIFARK